MTRVRLGISSCLLGEEVRYDGGHKRDAFLNETLGPFVEWVPVCPEVEAGMPVPREAMRLEGTVEAPRLMTRRGREDLTSMMNDWARRRVAQLSRMDLCGYVLKKDSPSCGMERVKVYADSGPGVRKGTGLFARALREALPMLPVEEEGRLNDPVLRENFIERVFSYRRFKDLAGGPWSTGRLVAFHTDHKLLLMAHSPAHYTLLGRVVAHAKGRPKQDVLAEYGAGLMEGLCRIATVRKNTNVLYHTLGYFRKLLSDDEKREMIDTIESYHRELVPLIVPITLLSHHVRRFNETYLARQIYLRPHPGELMLRNHA